MASRTEKKNQAKRELSQWYTLKPVSLLPVVAYLLGIIILPLARGESLAWATLSRELLTWAMFLFAALLLAWVVWRVVRRSDLLANLVFAAAITLAAVWSIGLAPPQRADAREMMRQKVADQVTQLKEKASAVIE